jgi:hypothetical protein
MLRTVAVQVSIGFVGLATLFGSSVSATTRSDSEIKEAVARARVPFVENRGQIPDQRVAFHAKTFAATCVIDKSGAVNYIDGTAVDGFAIRERFSGEELSPTGIDPSAVKVSSFRGNDPKKWHSSLPAFGAISLGEIGDGISLVLQAHNNNVEKIFTVAPGADPKAISVKVDGVDSLQMSPSGELELRTANGPFTFSAPVAYQENGGKREEVKVAYDLRGDTDYGFVVADYDRERPLVIDPIIASTYIGSSDADYGRAVVVDPQGYVYVAGHTGNSSSSFPTYATTPGSYQAEALCAREVVVSKFDPTLHTLEASTFIGGTGFDTATAMALEIGMEHEEGNHIVVAGLTTSDGVNDGCSTPPALKFPTMAGAFDEEHNGSTDVFVLRLNDDLSSLEASTLVGGSHMEHAFEPNTDRGPDLAMDTAGNIYVAGTTYSFDFPIIPTGKELVGYTPFQPGKHGDDDAFVIKLSNNLEQLLGWTYLGGSNEDRGTAVAAGFFDDEWHIFVSGHTESAEDWQPSPYEQFPITAGAFDETHNSRGGAVLEDGFVSRFNSDLTILEASTFIGGDREDHLWDMAVDQADASVLVVGGTGSTNFPTTPSSFMPTWSIHHAPKNGFVSRLNSSLTDLTTGTYLGGIPTAEHPDSYAETFLYGVAVDAVGTTWVTGRTIDAYQPTFPVLGLIQYRAWYDPDHYGGRDVVLTGFNHHLSRLHLSLHVAGQYDQEAWALFPRFLQQSAPDNDYVEITVSGWSDDGTSGDRFYPVFYNEVGFVDSYDRSADNDDVLVTTFRFEYRPLFADGFESGDDTEWSSSAP